MLGGAPSFHAFLELFRPLQDPIITQLLDRHGSRCAHTAVPASSRQFSGSSLPYDSWHSRTRAACC